jgi:hypothetical protein
LADERTSRISSMAATTPTLAREMESRGRCVRMRVVDCRDIIVVIELV